MLADSDMLGGGGKWFTTRRERTEREMEGEVGYVKGKFWDWGKDRWPERRKERSLGLWGFGLCCMVSIVSDVFQ